MSTAALRSEDSASRLTNILRNLPHSDTAAKRQRHTRFAVERSATALTVALLHLGNLDEIPAGVVKNGRDDGPHLDGRLSESNSRADETLVFRVHILHVKRRERNPVLHERLFELLGQPVIVRFQHELHA